MCTHEGTHRIYNYYSMSPSWIWSDKITNERVARVGYNHFISNKGKWNNCFSEFSNRVLPPISFPTILQSVRKENLAHYFPYDVKLGLLAHSRSFLANQKARNAIVGAENFLKWLMFAELLVWGLPFSQPKIFWVKFWLVSGWQENLNTILTFFSLMFVQPEVNTWPNTRLSRKLLAAENQKNM